MNAASVKTCGSCEHSTPSTVENMAGFVWCKKRQEAGGTMEAVFHNPAWQRECVAHSPAVEMGGFIAISTSCDKNVVLPSTGGVMTASVPMVIPAERIPVKTAPATPLITKGSQTPDLFADLFI